MGTFNNFCLCIFRCNCRYYRSKWLEWFYIFYFIWLPLDWSLTTKIRIQLDQIFPRLFKLTVDWMDDSSKNVHFILDFPVRNDPHLLEKCVWSLTENRSLDLCYAKCNWLEYVNVYTAQY